MEAHRPIIVFAFDGIRERLTLRMALDAGVIGVNIIQARRIELIKENIARFEKGEPMLNVVDKVKGY